MGFGVNEKAGKAKKRAELSERRGRREEKPPAAKLLVFELSVHW